MEKWTGPSKYILKSTRYCLRRWSILLMDNNNIIITFQFIIIFILGLILKFSNYRNIILVVCYFGNFKVSAYLFFIFKVTFNLFIVLKKKNLFKSNLFTYWYDHVVVLIDFSFLDSLIIIPISVSFLQVMCLRYSTSSFHTN